MKNLLSETLHASVDVARDTGWVMTLTDAQKKCVKLQKDILPRFGVSGEWLKSKHARLILGISAPLLIAALVWALPLNEKLKARMFAYLRQSLVLQLAGAFGDSYSSIVGAVMAMSGELGKVVLDSAEYDEKPARR